ncbi:hypothetical protein [Qipengyuania sp. MTN3-11]|uniref:hypothetical protein n=1 Tax=Qipengyuania sp. MTN3-11 TaxID=3056557 RepID=UPI0036F1D9AE
MFGLTNRDYAVLLLEEVDLEAQMLAVRDILRRNNAADEALDREIDAMRERATKASGDYGMHLENRWVDHLHGSVFQDAAHSMAAIGMLAPMLESLFVAIFRGIAGFRPPIAPVTPTGPRAVHVGDPDFWDPHFVYGARGKSKDISRGIVQLAESTGLASYLPADYGRSLDALFKYRNKMFHHGFEWPKPERQKFEQLIIDKAWPAEWFDRSTSAGETWIIYMSDVQIKHAMTEIDAILEGTGRFVLTHYPARDPG